MRKKKILQLGGGVLQCHSIVQLKDAGYIVYVIDKNPASPGFEVADYFAPIDITDTKKIVEYAKANDIDFILPVNDAGVVPAAEASKKLGLPNLDVENAWKATDKGLMRTCWAEAGLSQPRFVIVSNANEIREAIEKVRFPCILKPCLNWGSRGISTIHSREDMEFAIEFARKNDRNGRFIIEEYLEGSEMTVEGLARDNKVYILSKSDKVHQQHKQYRVAMELNYPSAFSKEILRQVDDLVINASKAIGLSNGAIHCEVIVNNKGVFLVEMAGRPGGGHIFGQIVEAQSGVPMPVALAKIFLKEEIDLSPKFQKGVCYHFFAPPPGIFKSIFGIDEATKVEGVIDIGFKLAEGTVVGSIAGDADRPGYLVTVGDTGQEAINVAQKVKSILQYKMADYNDH